MELKEVIAKLEALRNPKNVEGMARFGIRPKTKVLGISVYELRKIAKDIKKKKSSGDPMSAKLQHELALELWETGIHEARILAGYIAEPKNFTEKQFEKWIKGFDSWDVVDQVCSACLDKTSFVEKKIFELAERRPEFEKRTAFTLICCLTVHDKKMADKEFIKFFPLIRKAATDERNFVKKAVNWALRQIGKRNKALNREAIKVAKAIQKMESKSARWIASDALRELTSENVKKRISK
jgi:3-methyladenine DNA glycosylase AlkD